MKNPKLQKSFHSPLGRFYILASPQGICGLSKHKYPVPLGENTLLEKASLQLGEYFEGKRKSFTLPLDLEGSPFQKEVWAALRALPYGETCSYGELATKIGKPKASRAVGGANARNPLPIIIPCHRVLASGGKLGGYSGGLGMKKFLLKLEGSLRER